MEDVGVALGQEVARSPKPISTGAWIWPSRPRRPTSPDPSVIASERSIKALSMARASAASMLCRSAISSRKSSDRFGL